MPLHVRSIAVSIAVTCFFILSIVGCASGLSPFVCCKRALIGALLAYMMGAWAVRAINAILINAIITNQMNQKNDLDFATNRKIRSEEKGSGGKD